MKRWLFFLWNLWPPFLGAGIVINRIAPDYFHIQMKLKWRPWTRNIIGVQFGGSMLAMTDPIYMTMLMIHLGSEFRVIDKASSIDFKKLGKTKLYADFRLTPFDISEIKASLAPGQKMDWRRNVDITNTSGEVVATVSKVIQIKRLVLDKN